MSTYMLVDRTSDWFFDEDADLDPYLCSMQLLKALSTRRVQGIKYNRVQIVNTLLKRRSQEALDTLDSAIVILVSRNLLNIIESPNNSLDSVLHVTENGIEALSRFLEDV
ncbi:hypothetical protein [Paenibacillus sp. OK003]|uniref:hypothetical protein n=1 Tax=Paenibacillus sp. OK003 TaxID=1884380 RepID=UPI0008C5FD9E|nr:hypothetical protein [Paenibacillus sp. OK003]SEL85357.1 hypothetical protein SAMN05518856_12089 [Paenibacillus sp. OK003]